MLCLIILLLLEGHFMLRHKMRGITQLRLATSLAANSDEMPSYFRQFLDEDRLWKQNQASVQKGFDEKLKGFDEKLTDISTRIKENEPLWRKAGITYEVSVRNELRRVRGEGFAGCLVIRDLLSLSSACLPPDFDESQPTSGGRQEAAFARIQDRALSLAKLALTAVPSIQKWLDDAEKRINSEELKRPERKVLNHTINLLKGRLLLFHELPEGDKLLFLTKDRLGFFCYSSLLLADSSKGFVEDLEFDCKGTMELVGATICIFLAEIKSGVGDRTEAIVQLLKRIGFLYLAGQHSLPESQRSNFKFSASGLLCTPLDWEDPDQMEIESCKAKIGLLGYPRDIKITMQKFP